MLRSRASTPIYFEDASVSRNKLYCTLDGYCVAWKLSECPFWNDAIFYNEIISEFFGSHMSEDWRNSDGYIRVSPVYHFRVFLSFETILYLTSPATWSCSSSRA